MADKYTPRTKEEIATDPQPGDIFNSAWGYDQTNAHFYKVVKRTKAGVYVVPVGKFGAVPPEGGERLAFPDPDNERPRRQWSPKNQCWSLTPKPEFKRLNQSTDRDGKPTAWLSFSTYEYAYPYDGGGRWDTIIAGYPGH